MHLGISRSKTHPVPHTGDLKDWISSITIQFHNTSQTHKEFNSSALSQTSLTTPLVQYTSLKVPKGSHKIHPAAQSTDCPLFSAPCHSNIQQSRTKLETEVAHRLFRFWFWTQRPAIESVLNFDFSPLIYCNESSLFSVHTVLLPVHMLISVPAYANQQQRTGRNQAINKRTMNLQKAERLRKWQTLNVFAPKLSTNRERFAAYLYSTVLHWIWDLEHGTQPDNIFR